MKSINEKAEQYALLNYTSWENNLGWEEDDREALKEAFIAGAQESTKDLSITQTTTITKKRILEKGFREVWEDGYKLEENRTEYKYRIVLFKCSTSRPALYHVEIDKTPILPFDVKNPNTWSCRFYKVVCTMEEFYEILRLLSIEL